MNTKTLEFYRNEIDKLDEKLVVLLIKRMNIALSISDVKDNNISSIHAKDRVNIVLDRVAKLAIKNNADEHFIRNVYSVLIEELTIMQLKKKGLM